MKGEAIPHKMLSQDAFSQWLGIEILECEVGRCKLGMTIRPREAPVTTQTLPPDMHQSPKMRPKTPQTIGFIVGLVACLRLASLN